MWTLNPHRLELHEGIGIGYRDLDTDLSEGTPEGCEKMRGSGRPTIGAKSAAVHPGSEPNFPKYIHRKTKPGASEFTSPGSPEFLENNRGPISPRVHPSWRTPRVFATRSLGQRNDALEVLDFKASVLPGVKVHSLGTHPVPGEMTHGSKSLHSRRCSASRVQNTMRRKCRVGQEITVRGRFVAH